MREKTKKATFNLPGDILEEMDKVMDSGLVTSKNALVEQALIKELKEIKKQIRRERWQQAVKDPLFVKDIEDIETTFYSADAETARRIV
ncbi:MAG: hypothetical protein JW712_14445 [Dehalococcoidales bacterium]|nr:hypothetical protein [Dehalococcoidales bacterium]